MHVSSDEWNAKGAFSSKSLPLAAAHNQTWATACCKAQIDRIQRRNWDSGRETKIIAQLVQCFFIAIPLNCWRVVGFNFFFNAKLFQLTSPSMNISSIYRANWRLHFVFQSTPSNTNVAVAATPTAIGKQLIYLCRWPWESATTCFDRNTCACVCVWAHSNSNRLPNFL